MGGFGHLVQHVARLQHLDGGAGLDLASAPLAIVVVPFDQRPGLLLLLGLAPHEVEDVGVIGVQDDHLGGAAGFAAGLDHTGEGIEALHERDRTGSDPSAREFLPRGSDGR